MYIPVSDEKTCDGGLEHKPPKWPHTFVHMSALM